MTRGLPHANPRNTPQKLLSGTAVRWPGAQLHALSKQGKWAEMAALIPDDMVNEFTAVAKWDGSAEEIERRFGGVSDRVEFLAPDTESEANALTDVLDDIRDIPNAFVDEEPD